MEENPYQRLVTQLDPKDPCAEVYRILRTNLDSLSFDRSLKIFLVTSSTMQEGKSTTISNLAIAYAQQGRNVLLVSCNLRRPTLYKVFGVDKAPGLSDILMGKIPWHHCYKDVSDLMLGDFPMQDIMKTPGLENLFLITCGTNVHNPTELLEHESMDEFIKEVRDEFDVVLLDCPPLLPVADSMVLAKKADGVILVYQAGMITKNSLFRAKERLETVKASIMGIVLNDIRPESCGIEYKRSYYRYYKEDKKKKPSKTLELVKRLMF